MKFLALLVLALTSAAGVFAGSDEFGHGHGHGHGQPLDLETAWRSDINTLRRAIPQLSRHGQHQIWKEIKDVVHDLAKFTDNRNDPRAKKWQLLNEWERLLPDVYKLKSTNLGKVIDEMNEVFDVVRREQDHHIPH